MSTISVPLNIELQSKLDDLLRSGVAETRAGVMRKALTRLSEEEAINQILMSEQDIKEGRVFKGDLKKLLKKF